VPLDPVDFSVDWQKVRDAISPKTRMLFINTPHNPSGAMLDAGDMQALADIVRDTGIIILSDEVYEHIVFDGAPHTSMARYPQLRERSFIVGSFGKTYSVTGWKTGYVVAPGQLSLEFRKVHQFTTFSSFTPVQYAFADFLNERRGWPELSTFYQRKRDLFLSLLEGSRWRPLPSRGTYFQLLDYSAFSDEKDMDLALRLTREIGVASIPTSAFLYKQQPPPVLRFCFAKKDETLERACEKLRRL
jgi:methionine aminotransferase